MLSYSFVNGFTAVLFEVIKISFAAFQSVTIKTMNVMCNPVNNFECLTIHCFYEYYLRFNGLMRNDSVSSI